MFSNKIISSISPVSQSNGKFPPANKARAGRPGVRVFLRFNPGTRSSLFLSLFLPGRGYRLLHLSSAEIKLL